MIPGMRSRSIICCATPRGWRSAVRSQASLGVGAGAGQPHEIHGIGHGGLCREHAAGDVAPGSAWNYNDGNIVILSHLIRNAARRPRGQSDALRAAGIVRLRSACATSRIEFDASGNPEGSSQMLASARDWARFGLLYLNDGVAGGKRILPEGWVKYSASPTPNAWVGHGAGFWTNLGDSFGATYRVEHGWPRDAFFAKGTIGQYVIIIPSRTAGDRPARPLAELAAGGRWRVRPRARRRRRDRQQGKARRQQLIDGATAGPAAWPSRRDRIAPATGSRRRADRRGRSAPGGRA